MEIFTSTESIVNLIYIDKMYLVSFSLFQKELDLAQLLTEK